MEDYREVGGVLEDYREVGGCIGGLQGGRGVYWRILRRQWVNWSITGR